MAEEAKLQGVTREEAEKKLQEPNSGEKIGYMMVFDIGVSTRGNDPIWLISFRWVETTTKLGILPKN